MASRIALKLLGKRVTLPVWALLLIVILCLVGGAATLATYYLDNTAPSVNVVWPEDGSLVDLDNGALTVRVWARDDGTGVAKVGVFYRVSGATTWESASYTIENPAPGEVYVNITITGLSDGDYELYAVASDAAGNSAQSSTISFTAYEEPVTGAKIIKPPDGSVLRGTVSVRVAVYGYEEPGRVKLVITDMNDNVKQTIELTYESYDGTAWYYTGQWDTTVLPDGWYKGKVEVTYPDRVEPYVFEVFAFRVSTSPAGGIQVSWAQVGMVLVIVGIVLGAWLAAKWRKGALRL